MAYPVTKDKKVEKITQILISYAKENDFEFSLASKNFPLEYTFSYLGLLSMFLLEAKDIYEKVFNNHYSAVELLNTISPQAEGKRDVPFELVKRDIQYMNSRELVKKFPLQFFETPPDETLFDFEPRIEHLMEDDKSISFSILMHFVLYSVEEFIKVYKNTPSLLIDGKIPLDALCDKWCTKLAENTNYMSMHPLEVIQAIDARKSNSGNN